MNYAPLIWELAKTDFKLRYSGSLIGYAWALLKPLLMFLILNFVFANIFQSEVPYYSLNLLVGIVLWAYFTEGTIAGMNSLVAKAPLISKVAISKVILIVASTLHTTLTFFINVGIISIFFMYYHIHPSTINLLYAGLFIVLTYFLILGVSLGLAPFYVRYRDINQIWEVLLTLGFYASPIIYPLSLIPPHAQKYLWLNPMSYIINYMKLALIHNQIIAPDRLIVLVLAVSICVLAGSAGYIYWRQQLAEYL